jgi:large subunit ribosomal protein L23
MDTREILRKPIVTEKTTRLMAENKYCFVVDLRATKHQIQQAVEEIFKVKVLDVNTLRVLGKVKRQGRSEGKRPDWKKAVVTVAPGSRIQFFEGV